MVAAHRTVVSLSFLALANGGAPPLMKTVEYSPQVLRKVPLKRQHSVGLEGIEGTRPAQEPESRLSEGTDRPRWPH